MYDQADVIQLTHYLQEHPKKYLIFDFDDTLMTLRLPWDSYAPGIKSIIGEIDSDLVARYPGSNTKYLIYEALVKYGPLLRSQITQYRRQFERDCLQGVLRNDGLIAFVQEHAAAYQYSIWSSNDTQTILPQLQASRLDTLFSRVVGAADVNYPKPAPDGFYLLFDTATQDKADCLFIGDSSSDEKASKNAGIDFFKIQRP